MALGDGATSEVVTVAPKRAPANPRILSQWSAPVSTWTPATVRAALDSHDRGNFRQSSQLIDASLRCPWVAGDLNRRTRALASRSALPFTVEASSLGDGRKRETARKRCEATWWDVHPEPTIAAVLRDAIMAGVSVGRIWWALDAGDWRPRLSRLSLYGLDWNDWDGWTYSTRDGQRLRVTPGDGTWFLYAPHGDRSWMLGAIRQIGLPALMYLLTSRDWARLCERNGMAMLAIKEPHFATDDVEGLTGTTAADEFYSSIRGGIGSETILRLPQGQTKDEGGWEAEWMELKGRGGELFSQHLSTLKSEIHAALLGMDPDASARGGDGEQSNATAHNEYLAADAETLSTALREQVWKPDTAYNIDDDTDLAAWGRWDTRPQPNMKLRAETLDVVGTACASLGAVGVDVAPVVAEFGLRMAPKSAAVGGVPEAASAQPGTSPAADDEPDESEAA